MGVVPGRLVGKVTEKGETVIYFTFSHVKAMQVICIITHISKIWSLII